MNNQNNNQNQNQNSGQNPNNQNNNQNPNNNQNRPNNQPQPQNQPPKPAPAPMVPPAPKPAVSVPPTRSIHAGEPANKKVVTIAGVILIVVILGALLASGRLGDKNKEEKTVTDESSLPAGCENGYKFSVVTGEPCPTEESKESGTKATEKPAKVQRSTEDSNSSSYDKALALYAGRAIIIGENCKALPENLTVEKGSRILVANNAEQTVRVQFQSKDVSLRPYHYATDGVPADGSFTIKCDAKEVATITVQ